MCVCVLCVCVCVLCVCVCVWECTWAGQHGNPSLESLVLLSQLLDSLHYQLQHFTMRLSRVDTHTHTHTTYLSFAHALTIGLGLIE